MSDGKTRGVLRDCISGGPLSDRKAGGLVSGGVRPAKQQAEQ